MFAAIWFMAGVAAHLFFMTNFISQSSSQVNKYEKKKIGLRLDYLN